MFRGGPIDFSDNESDLDDFSYYPNEEASESSFIQETRPLSAWERHLFETATLPRQMEPKTSSPALTAVDQFKKALIDNNVEAITKILAEGGVSINHVFFGINSAGPPLSIAASLGHVEAVKVLLTQGASMAPNNLGITPFMSIFMTEVEDDALEEKLVACADIMMKLRRTEIDVNKVQNQRKTSLMFAAKSGSEIRVKFLLEKNALIDAKDSQHWTALCFATDEGHGHIVRQLLEAGADPSICTKEGSTAMELAASRGYEKMLLVLEKFEKKRSLLAQDRCLGETDLENTSREILSELDNVLLGMDMSQWMEKMKSHNVGFEEFLCLSEADLVEIGVNQVGDRKKMLNAISEIHKKDWQKTSFPKLSMKDKQRGIYFTCPDSVSRAANMAQHLRFLSANVSFLQKQLLEHPELLQLGQNVANVKDLDDQLKECKRFGRIFTKRVTALSRLVCHLKKDPKNHPIDLLPSLESELYPNSYVLSFAAAGAACVFVILALSRLT